MHALCHRAGAQTSQHHPLLHALSRTFKRLAIRHQKRKTEHPLTPTGTSAWELSSRGKAPGKLRTSSEYCNTAILPDVTHANPQQAVLHIRTGMADRDGSATSTSTARKRNPYTRLRQVSLDECSHKCVHLAAESFGPLGKKTGEVIDQLAASVVGGVGG